MFLLGLLQDYYYELDNMFNFEEIEIDSDLLERTNPIFNTARMTLFQLAAAGYDDAKDVVETLNLTREDTQDSKTVKADEDDFLLIVLLWK